MRFYNLLVTVLMLIGECNAAEKDTGASYFDNFNQISKEWQERTNKDGNISIDEKRGILILSGPENHFNYIERKFNTREGCVQVDINSGTDITYSWAPSIVLFWNQRNFLRVMFTPIYGLRIVSNADALLQTFETSNNIDIAQWYRVKIKISETELKIYFSPENDELKEVLVLPRSKTWNDNPSIILGKGHLYSDAKSGFANNAKKPGKSSWVAFDNFISGNSDKYAEQINAGIKQRSIRDSVNTADALQAVFWPQQTKRGKKVETLWVIPNEYQRISILYSNFAPNAFAEKAHIEMSVPISLGLKHITFGKDNKIKIESRQEGNNIFYSICREENWRLPPGLYGYASDKERDKPGWQNWPGQVFPELALYFLPQKGVTGKEIKARLVCDNVVGTWTKLDIMEMPPLPQLLKCDNGKGANITAYADVLITGNNREREKIFENMLISAKRLGFMYITSRNDAVAIKKAGLIPLCYCWWHYSSQCPKYYRPNANEKASEINNIGSNFCPVVIANGEGTYGKFLEEIRNKMQSNNAQGFLLDYECSMPLCFCERCRKAFMGHSKIPDVKWPDDVKTGGEHYDAWIAFRCWQGALYVKSIRDAVWRALPNSPFRAWIEGYNYRNNLKKSTIDVSEAAHFLTEAEIPHYTLPYDYNEKIESLSEGIEAVKNTVTVVNIPVIFCSSIDYPVGSTSWSDPDILDAQIMAVIGEGVRGLSFWGGHFQGAIDGRFMHKLVKWHNILVSSEKYLQNGKRKDKLMNISGNKDKLYSSLRILDDKALLILVNLSKEKKDISIAVSGFKPEGALLPYKQETVVLSPISLMSLEGFFIELEKIKY